jgi:hypothetical protein
MVKVDEANFYTNLLPVVLAGTRCRRAIGSRRDRINVGDFVNYRALHWVYSGKAGL